MYSMTFEKNKKVAPPITTPATQAQVSVKPGATTIDSIALVRDFVNSKSTSKRLFHKIETGVMDYEVPTN